MRLHVTCMLLCMSIVLASVAREPYCPPVPSCEERLLERVIRNELAMKTLQEEMGTKLDNAIKTAMKNISNAVSEMTQKASMTSLQLKTENEILKDQLTIPMIYFHANTPAAYILSSGQDVVYTSVRVNEGQGYDPKSGIFTVSIPGLYLFTVQYLVKPSTYTRLAIAHQGTQIQTSVSLFNSQHGNYYATFSMQVFIKAVVSDRIWVEASSDTWLYEGGIYNSFTGALIHM